jgi:cyclopropane-fatty-acyl-phospholipid synthase
VSSTPSTLPGPAPVSRWSPIALCELGWIPDALARAGMRRLMRQRLQSANAMGPEGVAAHTRSLIRGLRESPIAIETQTANTQHYEVPAAFFHAHLGPRLKYSCCLYPGGSETLAQAEEAMLTLYAERAGLQDGQRILDLGCGWGSLTLWLAARLPRSEIVGLSNSHGQAQYIAARASERGLRNVRIVTGNVVDFEFGRDAPPAGFDRVVSIEMFEHMKNYASLLGKVARWLRPGGRLFVHLFAHRTLSYHFEDQGDADWMTRYFFAGGTMPSEALLLHFQDDLRILDQWWVDGRHYERTANDWLDNLDAARTSCLEILAQGYGPAEARVWLQRWRMFYMAVAELFGYRQGSEWGVAHYLFEKR